MFANDASPTGVNDTNILWVLIALATGDVELEDAAQVIGLPEGQVQEMLAMASVRGRNAVDHIGLRTSTVAPSVSLVRTEDAEALHRVALAFVPETVIRENAGLATAVRRIGKIVERGRVWTNN